jgi:hypothetical protein
VAASGLRAKLADGKLLVDQPMPGAVRRTLRSEAALSARTLLTLLTLETYLRQVAGEPGVPRVV